MDRKLLNKLKFHLVRLRDGGTDEDWVKVIEVLGALERGPTTTSTAALAKLLKVSSASLLHRRIPGDFARLMHELEHVVRESSTSASVAHESSADNDDAMLRVATLLHGRALLIIGGDPRPEHQERLRAAFALSAVHWPPTRERSPDVGAFEPWIARGDVAVVVLLIRWIRHALGEVSSSCERHSKPMARITGGYNPSQIAVAVLEQCGKRLAARP